MIVLFKWRCEPELAEFVQSKLLVLSWRGRYLSLLLYNINIKTIFSFSFVLIYFICWEILVIWVEWTFDARSMTFVLGSYSRMAEFLLMEFLFFPFLWTQKKNKKTKLEGHLFLLSPMKKCCCIRLSNPNKDKNKRKQIKSLFKMICYDVSRILYITGTRSIVISIGENLRGGTQTNICLKKGRIP